MSAEDVVVVVLSTGAAVDVSAATGRSEKEELGDRFEKDADKLLRKRARLQRTQKKRIKRTCERALCGKDAIANSEYVVLSSTTTTREEFSHQW